MNKSAWLDIDDPIVMPTRIPEVTALFPPTILMTSTLDES